MLGMSLNINRVLNILFISLFAGVLNARAAQVIAFVELSPAGSFEAKTTDPKLNLVCGSNQTYKAQNVSLDLATLKTGIDLRDTHMKEKFLHTKNHPTAELELRPLVKPGLFSGVLSLNGVKNPVDGTFKVSKENQYLAKFRIELTKFNLKPPSYLGVSVENEVPIEVRGVCKK